MVYKTHCLRPSIQASCAESIVNLFRSRVLGMCFEAISVALAINTPRGTAGVFFIVSFWSLFLVWTASTPEGAVGACCVVVDHVP